LTFPSISPPEGSGLKTREFPEQVKYIKNKAVLESHHIDAIHGTVLA
jgi:hypothetical protein